MNCQYCGKKIGIIENWRYGRFCSKEHQDDFRDEATQLAASVLGARPERTQTFPVEHEAEKAPPRGPKSLAVEAAPEPDPPRMEAVNQQCAAAVDWKRKAAAGGGENGDRVSNERHQRSLKILAANERTPPPVLEKDRRRRLRMECEAYRFGEVVAPGDRSVLVPPSGAVQKRPKLRFCERLLPLNVEQEAQAALPEFECVWDGAGQWTVEAAGAVDLEFGDYLGDYSPEQPWEQWDWDALLQEAKYAQSMNEERDRRLGRLRSRQQAETPQSAPGGAAAGPRQQGAPAIPAFQGSLGGSQQGAQARRVMPALNVLAPGGMPGQGAGRSAAPASGSGRAGQPGAQQQAGGAMAGGMTAPAMPSYPGRMALRPAGGPGAGPRGARAGGDAGPGPLVRIVPVAGAGPVAMEWVELAPPLFLALCKIEEPLPAVMPRRSKTLHPVHREAAPDCGQAKPGFAGSIAAARMAGMCEQLRPGLEPVMAPPAAFEPRQPRTEAVGEEHEPSLPEYRLAARRFRIPPAQASDRRTLNLRPIARTARPDPGMGLGGRRRTAG